MEYYWTSGMTQEMSLLTLMNIGSSSVEINLITCQMCPESLSMKETQLTWEHRNLCAILTEGSKSRCACSEIYCCQKSMSISYVWFYRLTIPAAPRVQLEFSQHPQKLSANSLWKEQWNKYCLWVTLVEGTLYPEEKDMWKHYQKRKTWVEPQSFTVLLA